MRSETRSGAGARRGMTIDAPVLAGKLTHQLAEAESKLSQLNDDVELKREEANGQLVEAPQAGLRVRDTSMRCGGIMPYATRLIG